ncbi:MAG: cytochrome c3 family protein [Thermoanaerobaculia bacterium]
MKRTANLNGRARPVVLAIILFAAAAPETLAQFVDPPHSDVLLPDAPCLACHTPHHADGISIIKAQTVPLLCQSCHNVTGQAANRPLSDTDQAFPGLSGTSHRWDSGPSGHVEAAGTNLSAGLIRSAGAFTGRIERTYTITVTGPPGGGDAGIATFSWTDSEGGSGSGTSGAAVPLDAGLTLDFIDAPASPSFLPGDTWTLWVRTDLRAPDPGIAFEADMANRFQRSAEKVVCTVCHNQHWQDKQPFDPNAPPFTGAGSGWTGTGVGRHYQRVQNDTNQMCTTCHEVRDVTSSDQGSHPVGVPIPADPTFQTPLQLPLDAGANVRCMTCHAPHFFPGGNPATSGTDDGYILRAAITEVCFECHTLADRVAGSHFDAATGVLWPGGEYGSSFPAHTAEKRGSCVNCHWPHGWPDDATPAQDYPRLWVERYDIAADGSDPADAEDLCFTCHDGSPAGTDIRGEFQKGTNGADIFHHPISDPEQTAGRSVECVDCHNPHKARPDNKLAGATGIDLAGNPVGPGTGNERDLVQYELCFKCHGDTFNSSRPGTSNKRLDFQTSNSAFHPVAGQGQNQSANLNNALLGGLSTTSTIDCTDCHNNEATADAFGPASNSPASPKGPHGSTNAAIRRAEYWTDLQGPASWNRSNFELCFLCHDPARLVEARRDDDNPPASTNFYDTIDGRDNLHEVHLVDRIDDTRATCKNCHFNVHSNRTADNTQYNVNGTIFTSPPAGFKTHLVNFSPDITPFGGRALPEWWINTSTRQRRCYLSCHGADMEGFPYRPAAAGDDSPTIP